MKIKLIDRVKECPPCPCPDIRFEYETGMSQGTDWIEQTYIMRCTHERVCAYRREHKS